jgi:hypothetical protein
MTHAHIRPSKDTHTTTMHIHTYTHTPTHTKRSTIIRRARPSKDTKLRQINKFIDRFEFESPRFQPRLVLLLLGGIWPEGVKLWSKRAVKLWWRQQHEVPRFVHECIHVHVKLYVRMCVYKICMCVYIYIYTYIHTYIYIYIYMGLNLFVYVRVYMYIYVCVYIYIYIYIYIKYIYIYIYISLNFSCPLSGDISEKGDLPWVGWEEWAAAHM